MKKRDLLSISDFDKSELLHLLLIARKFKESPPADLLRGRILASCFFEPSTRTRLSFESAMIRLGGSVVGFADGQVTSSKKGESLSDSMKIISGYADVIAIRHPKEGSAHTAADAADIPVINAGDGSREHPTQTLLDLFTIWEAMGRIDGLHIALMGDLKYGRTTHSLALALCHFHCKVSLISPEALQMPSKIVEELQKSGIEVSIGSKMEEVIPSADIAYMTRIQEERFQDPADFEKVKGSFVLTASHLINANPPLRILHPLPRVQEIDAGVDSTPHAHYFAQAANGLPVRMALLAYLLGAVR